MLCQGSNSISLCVNVLNLRILFPLLSARHGALRVWFPGRCNRLGREGLASSSLGPDLNRIEQSVSKTGIVMDILLCALQPKS